MLKSYLWTAQTRDSGRGERIQPLNRGVHQTGCMLFRTVQVSSIQVSYCTSDTFHAFLARGLFLQLVVDIAHSTLHYWLFVSFGTIRPLPLDEGLHMPAQMDQKRGGQKVIIAYNVVLSYPVF